MTLVKKAAQSLFTDLWETTNKIRTYKWLGIIVGIFGIADIT